MHTGIPSVVIDKDGECNYCKIHDKLEAESKKFDFHGFVEKLRKKRKNKKYDCLIGISGGIDSSFLLEYTVKTLRLRPLVIHFQNWWNCPEAEHNIKTMVQALNVDFITYAVDKREYDEICKSFLFASVSDADILNDMVMTYFMFKTAVDNDIKCIFNGHDFRHEGTSPVGWSYMDTKYIESVHEAMGGLPIKNVPMLPFMKQLWYALMGIKRVQPLYYIDYEPEREKVRLKHFYGWKDYGEKHSENDYTWWVSVSLLPEKYGIDKRITYLSADMRMGRILREEAENVLKISPFRDKDFKIADNIKSRLRFTDYDWNDMMDKPRRYYTEFKTYKDTFKRWKWLLWILMKMKIIFPTMYYKYCK